MIEKKSAAFIRLKEWLASNPEIPRFRNQVNKAEICRKIGIARSTANENSAIRTLLNELAVRPHCVVQPATSRVAVDPVNNVLENTCGSSEHYGQTEASRDSLSLRYLMRTGRVVR